MYLETFARLWRWGNALCFLGVLQFVGCAALAMLHYPGGTLVDRHSVGYTFFENYLSDLGRTAAWSGADNGVSAALFNTSIVLLGLSTVPLFLFLPLHAPDRAGMLWAAAAFGVLSVCGLVGIGLTPYDRYLDAHVAAHLWWILPFLIAVFFHFLALMQSERCPLVFPVLSLALVTCIAVYAVASLGGGMSASAGQETSFAPAAAAWQKYVFLGSLAWYAVFSLRMMCLVELSLPERRSTVDRSARRYLKRLPPPGQ